MKGSIHLLIVAMIVLLASPTEAIDCGSGYGLPRTFVPGNFSYSPLTYNPNTGLLSVPRARKSRGQLRAQLRDPRYPRPPRGSNGLVSQPVPVNPAGFNQPLPPPPAPSNRQPVRRKQPCHNNNNDLPDPPPLPPNRPDPPPLLPIDNGGDDDPVPDPPVIPTAVCTEETCNEILTQIAALQARLDEIAGSAVTKDDLAKIQPNVQLTEEQLNQFSQTVVQAIQDNPGKVPTELKDILVGIQRVENSISSLSTQVEGVDGHVVENGKRLKALQIAIKDNQQYLTQIIKASTTTNNGIDGLGNDLDEVQNGVSDLLVQMQRLERSQVSTMREALKGAMMKFRMSIDPSTGEILDMQSNIQ